MQFIAWDIETDTSGGFGLDPGHGGILSIAAARYETVDGLAYSEPVELDSFFGRCDPGDTAGETDLLGSLDLWLFLQESAPLVGWSSARFDAPFCHRRAELLGVPVGLEIRLDPSMTFPFPPVPGFDGAYAHRWHGHWSTDLVFGAYTREWCAAAGIGGSLKKVGRHYGLDPIEVDRKRIHLLSDEELRAYNRSDVVTTAALFARSLCRAEAA